MRKTNQDLDTLDAMLTDAARPGAIYLQVGACCQMELMAQIRADAMRI